MAESEVFDADQYDFNPCIHNFKSLFFDDIPPRIKDLPSAISYYESLSDEQIESRYSIHYWETCTLGAYDSLRQGSIEYFHRSIDKRVLARREVQNVDLLLNEGKCQIMPNKEHLLITEIPAAYEKLIKGIWSEFFIAEELEAYEIANEEDSQKGMRAFMELNKKRKEMSDSEFIDCAESIISNGTKYIDYFNVDWIVSMQIQSLIWYKEFLKKVIKYGTPYLPNQIEGKRDETVRDNNKGITFNRLRRSNDGYEAITTSYKNFVSVHDRNPQWGELMLHMLENPPNGYVVSGKQRRQKVEELSIEGIEKPIDRDAFRKRFVRYFNESDIKQDNS